MPSTSDQMVSNALRLIKVKGGETPLHPTELDDGRLSLNRLGVQLDAEGFELGFTALTTGADLVTIPDYAEDFYTNQLAARLSPEYIDEIPPFLVEAIKASRRVVVREINRKAVGQTGTYQNIIYGAIEMLGAKSGNEPISATELQNGIPMLVDLMLELEAQGFRLSFEVNSSTDLTKAHGLPDWSWRWIKAELGISLAPSYSVPPNEVIARIAKQGRTDAYQRTALAPTANYPETMPLGESRYYQGQKFYGNPSRDDIRTGSGGKLLTDEGLPIGQQGLLNDT